MKPAYSILDDSFRYVPASSTSVAETWRRFGWRPTTDEKRKGKRRPTAELVVDAVAAVTPIRRAASTTAPSTLQQLPWKARGLAPVVSAESIESAGAPY